MQEFSYQFTALGTEIVLSFVAPNESLANVIYGECLSMIISYEKKFSRFLPDSELSLLNQKKELEVSKEFLAVLIRSLELYRETKGVFNPLLQVSALGYQTDYRTLPSTQQHQNLVVYNSDFETVIINPKTRKVTLQAGHQLDFGGILKGYLAEKISREVSAKHNLCTGNIINLGGDLHTRGKDEAGMPFIFFIYNPITKEQIPIPLTDKSLATSGTYKRTWLTDTGTKHHIVEACTHDSLISTATSASVVSEDGALGEAYAKVILASPTSNLKTNLPKTVLQYLLIHTDGSVHTNVI